MLSTRNDFQSEVVPLWTQHVQALAGGSPGSVHQTVRPRIKYSI